MGLFNRSSSSSTSGADRAGGTDWDAKANAAGSQAPAADAPTHAHQTDSRYQINSGGSGGTLSDDQL